MMRNKKVYITFKNSVFELTPVGAYLKVLEEGGKFGNFALVLF